MFPATTNGTGQCALPGPLDVCKTPSPAGPVPLPYPNFGMLAQTNGGTCSKKVKITTKKGCTTKTELTMTTGDEPGVAGGVVSSRFKGPLSYKKGSSKVKIEGESAVHLMSMTGHNGSNANMPTGLQVAPSQTSIIVGP